MQKHQSSLSFEFTVVSVDGKSVRRKIMNFKKYQRRIPMNFKKIIPLTFAALSACSDSSVVGADEQANSVAVHLDEKEIASKTATLVKESSKPNVVTTVIISSDLNEDRTRKVRSTQVLEGDDTYNRTMNSIIAVDTINTSYKTEKGWVYYSYHDFEAYSLYGDFYSMQDENGVIYGPIALIENATKMGDGWHLIKSLNCWNESKWFVSNDSVFEFMEHLTVYAHDAYAKIDLDYSSRDSLVLNQFVEDCIADGGTVFKSARGIDTQRQPELRCTLPSLHENPIRISRWEKYASYVINNCRSDIVPEMRIPQVSCPPEKCDGPSLGW
jgi:hypothetical protein